MSVRTTKPPTVRFTQVRNEWVRDARLSWKARGLLTYLHSHADGYELSLAQIVRAATDGKDAVATGLRELESLGYLACTRPERAGQGRWGETEYELADPFDASGNLIVGRGAENPPDPAPDEREIRRSGFSGAADPRRTIRSIEEQGEKTKVPIPTGSAAQVEIDVGQNGNGHVPTINQRTKILADEHFAACDGLENWQAVRSVVVAAVSAGHWSDEEIRKALAAIRETRLALTRPVLRRALTSPDTLTSAYGSRPRTEPYRNPQPGSYTIGNGKF